MPEPIHLNDPLLARNISLLNRLASQETDECVLWPRGCTSRGYPAVRVNKVDLAGHRTVCEWYHGPPPSPSHHAAHGCGVSRCVNPRHLRWATPTENQADRKLHGTGLSGESHPGAKITEDLVIEICERYSSESISQKALASEYGLSQSHVNRIITGKSWGSVWETSI